MILIIFTFSCLYLYCRCFIYLSPKRSKNLNREVIILDLLSSEQIFGHVRKLYNLGHYEEVLEFLEKLEKSLFGKTLSRKFGRALLSMMQRQKLTLILATSNNIYNYSGNSLRQLGRYQQALLAFDKALTHKQDYPEALYGKACCHAFLDNMSLAMENLKLAIAASPEEFREKAQTESAFDPIRQDRQFQELISG
ncbi:TPR end-of-group domain-containing protein [Altericista sp. CCNU0014]|uniref:TPR end-of-group domain-containing protein n=1 Tax=Altericista sp. CCNU0014 TaxID=3082949 RepID=UPI00384EBBF1